MKVLALGATGFIGSYVVRQLIDQGHQVVVFHRGETQAELPDSVATSWVTSAKMEVREENTPCPFHRNSSGCRLNGWKTHD
jgi:uncharacterized protein YbjT (DUF2867 family)